MTCQRAAELMSRALDIDLPLRLRVELCIHAFLCRACRQFRRQLAVLHRSFEKMFSTTGAGIRTAGLSSSSKDHLKAIVLFHLNGES